MRPALAAILLSLLPAGPVLADGRSIIVLDGSGSMWGQIDGRAKLEIAREALASVLSALDPATEIGLMAYGHREKGACGDIELVVPPGPGTAQAITEAANRMKFLGKTPLTEAVRRAALELRSTEAKATVILITDGIETCAADPCALGAELEASGVDFTAHVVGFGLTDDEGRAVACLAQTTGGRYIQASDAGQLVSALQSTVAPALPTTPPSGAMEATVDPVLLLIEGGEEPEERLLGDATFAFFPIAADGTVAADPVERLHGSRTASLPAGRYQMRTTLHEAEVTQEVTVGPASAPSTPTAVLDAGILNLTLRPAPEADPDPEAHWSLRGPKGVSDAGYQTAYRVFPSGEYTLTATLGTAEIGQTVMIEAGRITDLDLVVGVGEAVVEALYLPGLKVEGSEFFVQIFAPEPDAEGTRRPVAHAYGPGARFDLPPGDYLAVVTLGQAVAEEPFTARLGERVELGIPLNAGVAAFTFGDAGTLLQVFATETDPAGNRKAVGQGFGPEWQSTYPAGEYLAVIDFGGRVTETPFTVTAGERLELMISAP